MLKTIASILIVGAVTFSLMGVTDASAIQTNVVTDEVADSIVGGKCPQKRNKVRCSSLDPDCPSWLGIFEFKDSQNGDSRTAGGSSNCGGCGDVPLFYYICIIQQEEKQRND